MYSAFLRSEITLKFLKEIQTETVCISPNLYIGWLNNTPLTNGKYTAKMYKETLCQDYVTVQSYDTSTNQLILGAELIIAHRANFSFSLGYEANLGYHYSVQEGNANLNWRF